jgi:hypothetical protein
VAQRDFRVWDQVPRGSRLHLRLEASGAVLARARVTRSTGDGAAEEGHLSHVQLLEGTDALSLEEDGSGTVTVSIHFPAPAGTAVLSAGVVAPDGRPFKRSFRYAVAGSRGDTFRAILLLTTETLDLEHGGGGTTL